MRQPRDASEAGKILVRDVRFMSMRDLVHFSHLQKTLNPEA